MSRIVVEEFKCYGHRNILATHKSTFEITKEPDVSHRGDCIIAVRSEKACLDLSDDLRNAIRDDRSRIRLELRCGDLLEEVYASGCKKLTLESPVSMVVRRSSFICGRTLAIKASKSARDLSRELIERLKSGSVLNVRISVFL